MPHAVFHRHITSASENDCLGEISSSDPAKQLWKATVEPTQKRGLPPLHKHIRLPDTLGVSLHSWFGEFCFSFNMCRFPIPLRAHLALGAKHLPYISQAVCSALLGALPTSGK